MCTLSHNLIFDLTIILDRILVQSGIHDDFVDAMCESVAGLKQGGPFDDGVTVGPLINESAVDKVRNKLRQESNSLCNCVSDCAVQVALIYRL